MIKEFKNRKASFPVDELFLKRVSSRAFDPDKEVSKNTLMSCFEAARWAPSSYNNQPWRYVYAFKGSPGYEKITDSLIDFNKAWCKNAQVLIIICSKKNFEHNGKPSSTASFDTGSSAMSLILQAEKLGLITHAMEGFNHQKLKESFQVSDAFQIECVLALGYLGSIDELADDLKSKETPSLRKSFEDFVMEDKFGFK